MRGGIKRCRIAAFEPQIGEGDYERLGGKAGDVPGCVREQAWNGIALGSLGHISEAGSDPEMGLDKLPTSGCGVSYLE